MNAIGKIRTVKVMSKQGDFENWKSMLEGKITEVHAMAGPFISHFFCLGRSIKHPVDFTGLRFHPQTLSFHM